MPVYEYRCEKCGRDFELFRPMSQSAKPAKCPNCGGTGKRLVSAFGSNLAWTSVGTGGVFREAPPKPVTPTSRPAMPKAKIVKKAPKPQAKSKATKKKNLAKKPVVKKRTSSKRK